MSHNTMVVNIEIVLTNSLSPKPRKISFLSVSNTETILAHKIVSLHFMVLHITAFVSKNVFQSRCIIKKICFFVPSWTLFPNLESQYRC